MAARAFPNGPPVASFFVARTPLLPFDELVALNEGLRAPGLRDEAALEAALVEDWNMIRARLEVMVARREVQEALFLATPDLVARMEQVGALEDAGRAELAIARYVFRMCGRPTPFGLFAGFTVGSVGTDTRIELAPLAAYGRHVRLDNDYVFTLVERLESVPELASALRLFPNSSLYKAAGSFRYAETRLEGILRTNHLVAAGATDYLEATLERARDGATAAQLAASLVEADPEVERDDAKSFIEQLVQSKILVSELAPAITGQEPLDDLLERLSRHPAATAVREELKDCADAVEAIAGAPLGLGREDFVRLAKRMEALPAKVELSRFLQVDLVKPGHAAVLGSEPLAEIVRGVELLWRLAPGVKDTALTRFVSAFFERYESRDVPLVEALDEDLGLPFRLLGRSPGGAAPLLDGLQFRAAPEGSTSWTGFHSFLQARLVDALMHGRDEITIEPSDVESVQTDERPSLPAAFSVVATIGAASSAALARGEFDVVLQSAGGPSGVNLLGRFCHADEELHAHVAEHVRSEERHEPDAIYAEIAHLPEGRTGNVIARPLLRDYEIPYLGVSSAPADRQIPVTDLSLAMEKGRLVLRSRRLGREVIPRLTSAHNSPASGLPIYRFLSAFQDQRAAPGLAWDWGPLASSPFLPRVRSGRVVLAPARWRLSKRDANRLRDARGAARYRLVQEWRSDRRLPRHVLFVESDNRLPLDLDSVLCVEVLAELTGRTEGATLQEMIPSPDALLARGPEGRFVHELIVPFVQPVPERTATAPAIRAPSAVARSFQPGSEWLYAKFYTSESNTDRVLRDVVAPLKRLALDGGGAERWFFVRYTDPQDHLRVRFQGDPVRLGQTLLPALRELTEPLLRDRTLWRVQLDTYEREIERYGGDDGMRLAEQLFFADSEAVLALIDGLTGDQGARARSNLALAGIDRLLDQFRFEVAAKRSVIVALRDGTARDVRADKRLRIQMGDKFRAERRELNRLLDGSRDQEDGLRDGLEILARRSTQIAPIAAELASLARAGRLTTELPGLVSSYIHMFVNRLMRSQHKRQEFVLYDYLDRIYESRLARTVKT